MKKIILICGILALCGCTHTTEDVVGYNEEGLTLVRVCKAYGDPMAAANAYGSECWLELRDYGRITNNASTINVISNDKR